MMNFFRTLFTRRRRYDDLSASIREHIEDHVEELMEEGMPREQAERTARRDFGNVDRIAQQGREAWQWPAVESLLADLRFALRRLHKTPAFTLTVLATLAIGIGANTAVFSVLDSVLIKPLAYPNPGQLVDLHLEAPGAAGLPDFADGLRLSTSMFLTFAAHNKSFESVGIFTDALANVTGLDQPEEAHVTAVSDGLLQTLAVAPVIGRWLPHQAPDENHKHLMLSYGYWQRHFAGSPAAIGRVIHLDDESFEIVGVMPRNFRVADEDFDLLTSMVIDPAKQKLAGFGYQGVARLRPGVTIAQANSDIARLLNVWMDSWTNGPGTNPHFYETWKITPAIRPLKDAVLGNVRGVLWVVMATISLVMLIACVNVANLLLVRADARQHELSVRAALGANRARLARELLLESLSLSVLGGIAGIAVAQGALRLLLAYGPTNLPRLNEITLDLSSLGFALLLALFSGLLFGAIPAFKYSSARASLSASVRTASASRDRQRSRNILVIAQVAIALVLLVCALLMIRTFVALRSVNPGFADAQRVETVRVTISGKAYVPDGIQAARTLETIEDKLASIPGVDSVGFAAAVPMDGNGPMWDEVHIEGKDYGTVDPPLRFYNFVSPGYFNSIGTRIVAGRDINWGEMYALHPVVIVSEGFARESWGSAQTAVGKRLREFSDGQWFEVIGVVEDVYERGVDAAAPSLIYWPTLYKIASNYTGDRVESQRSVAFVLHSSRAGTQSLITQIQQAVWSVDSEIPLTSTNTMQQYCDKSMARTSFTLAMLAIAGSMALILGLLGIYGVIAYAVSQRTREIGIRLALGAQRSTLRWIFVRSALMLTGAGVIAGTATAAGLTQFMKSLLFGISPLDPVTFLCIPLVLVTAAALASYLAARRAASVDPVEALRAE